MLIKINGDMTEIPEGSTIREAIEISKAPYSKGYLLMTNSSRWLVSLKTIIRNS